MCVTLWHVDFVVLSDHLSCGSCILSASVPQVTPLLSFHAFSKRWLPWVLSAPAKLRADSYSVNRGQHCVLTSTS